MPSSSKPSRESSSSSEAREPSTRDTTVTVDENAVAVSEPVVKKKRKAAKINKDVANGGKRWTSHSVSFYVRQ